MGQPETFQQLIREGRGRLYPGLTNPHWLVLKKRREIFEDWVAKLPGGKMLVLDIGGRIQPYRPLLERRLTGYVATDVRLTPLVNVLACGEQLPFARERFDLVICTQVLQYVPEPGTVIDEVARVLRPGGYFFLSVPSSYPRDAEEECWRFLPAGLRHLLASFAHVEIIPEGRSVSGFFRTINVCLSIFVRYPSLRQIYSYTICPLINLLGSLLERLSGSVNDQCAVNYSVIAQK